VGFRASAEIFSTIAASIDIAGLCFGQAATWRLNHEEPFYNPCTVSAVVDSPREAQSAEFSFERT